MVRFGEREYHFDAYFEFDGDSVIIEAIERISKNTISVTTGKDKKMRLRIDYDEGNLYVRHKLKAA